MFWITNWEYFVATASHTGESVCKCCPEFAIQFQWFQVLVSGQMKYYSRHANIIAQLLKQSSMSSTLTNHIILASIFAIRWRNFINTFAASYLNTQGLNNSCLKSPASTLVNLTFQSRALRSFSLNQLRNLSL